MRLASGPGIEIDHIGQRRERLAARDVIVSGQALDAVRLGLELHTRCTLAFQDGLFAGFAGWGFVAASTHGVEFVEIHAIQSDLLKRRLLSHGARKTAPVSLTRVTAAAGCAALSQNF